jgi:guanylate kinase
MAGKLIVIAAPSGCGKTTMVRKILEVFPDLYFSISATTREKRKIETDGKDYFFISAKEFNEKIEKNEFVEWNEHFGNKYGTLKSNIERRIKEGKDIIFDVDVNGALNIKKYDQEAQLIFIKPPDLEALRNRLLKRGSETEESLNTRLQRAKEELEKSKYFDHIIINDKLNIAIQEIINLIKKIINK